MTRLAITIGDPGGVGPEVALKSIAEGALGDSRAMLVGPRALWDRHAATLGPEAAAVLDRVGIVESPDPGAGAPVEIGKVAARHGVVAEGAVRRAVEMCMAGDADAVVTAPLCKESLLESGSAWTGHTEMLRDLAGAADVAMLFVGGGLRVALATIHVPLIEVFQLLTPELIEAKAALLDGFLRSTGLVSPILGVAGLNPHAGEEGMFGDEDRLVIQPAVEALVDRGIRAVGPRPADTIFHEALEGRYDAVLAMYHDQGLIPVKTLAFDEAVNVTIGLPFIRTSPDHGTAFDIAARGIARTGSMKAAIRLAAEYAAGKPSANG